MTKIFHGCLDGIRTAPSNGKTILIVKNMLGQEALYLTHSYVKIGHKFYISKKYFENLKRLESIVNIFVFFIKKLMSKQREKIFHLTPILSN